MVDVRFFGWDLTVRALTLGLFSRIGGVTVTGGDRAATDVAAIWLTPRRARVALITGAALTAATVLTVFCFARTRSIGRLVPRQSEIVWESPVRRGPIVAEHADLMFVLTNAGRTPVKILSIQSGCACVKPVAEPSVVGPGGITRISAKATAPAVGETKIEINVQTDSPASPQIALTARLRTWREPPFLFDVRGDISFRGRYAKNMRRGFSVTSVENPGQTIEPTLSSDLPYLKLQKVGVVDREVAGIGIPFRRRPVVIARTRKYEARITELPPYATFSGEIIVNDPFGASASKRLDVFGELSADDSSLKVVPRTLLLDRMRGAGGNLLVLCDPPAEEVSISADDSWRHIIRIDEEKREGARQVHLMRVALLVTPDEPHDPIRVRVRHPGTGHEAEVLIRFKAERVEPVDHKP